MSPRLLSETKFRIQSWSMPRTSSRHFTHSIFFSRQLCWKSFPRFQLWHDIFVVGQMDSANCAFRPTEGACNLTSSTLSRDSTRLFFKGPPSLSEWTRARAFFLSHLEKSKNLGILLADVSDGMSRKILRNFVCISQFRIQLCASNHWTWWQASMEAQAEAQMKLMQKAGF